MQLWGYAIIGKTEYHLEEYMRWPVTVQNLHHLTALRNAVAFLNPCHYRGIGVQWLDTLPSLDSHMIELFAGTGMDMSTEAPARRRFRELLGESEAPPDVDEDLFSHESQAQEVFSILRDSSRYELRFLRRREFPKSDGLLGYDIGYWGGDHFSLICDSFVAPTWHPPQPDVFCALAEQLRGLNEHLLFPTADSAGKFCAWYGDQDWAETVGKFEIIQVSTVEAD